MPCSDSARQPDMPFLRSCALDLLAALRDQRDFGKEQLFADAIVFYRWYFTHIEEADGLDLYWDQFLMEYPSCLNAEENLQEAVFLTWFIVNEFHTLPLFPEKLLLKQKRQKR